MQALPWVLDGTNETERDAIDWLSLMGTENDAAATSVIAMSWIQDGVTDIERDALEWLRWLTYNSNMAAAAVFAMTWVQDGVTETERDTLERLSWLAHENETATIAVIHMPFLESLEPDDVLAIRGIDGLARNEDGSLLSALMDHPTLRNGITDAKTTLVTAASTLWDADEIRRMLNPGYASVEVLSEGTELTPSLKISIVSPGSEPGPRTTGVVGSAVTFAERAMGIPLPISHVIVVLSDKTGDKGIRSSSNIRGYAISILPELAQERRLFDTYLLGTQSTHETAHFYWIENEGWINEGGAKMIEWMYGVENGASPGMLGDISRNWGCYDAHDLAALSSMAFYDFDEIASYYACNHYLGYKLFKELFDNLGADEFKAGLRELYRLSLATKDTGEKPGIAEVRQAFPDQAEVVEKHWSGNQNSPENRPYDEGVYRPSHGLVQWEQYPIYDGQMVTFSGGLLGHAVLYRNDKQISPGDHNFLLNPADDHKFAGFILPPIEDGSSSTLGGPKDTVAVEYRLDGSKFAVKFPFPKDLGAPSDYVVLIWGFQDGSKTPVIYENGDILGYARIRIE